MQAKDREFDPKENIGAIVCVPLRSVMLPCALSVYLRHF